MFRSLWQKVSTAWLIASWSVGVLLGIAVIGGAFPFRQISLGVSIVLFFVVLKKRFAILIPVAILAGFLFGGYRSSFLNNQLNIYKEFYNQSVAVIGSVREDIEQKSDNQIAFRLAVQTINNEPAEGEIYVTVSSFSQTIKRGDQVQLSGKLQTGFGGFVGSIYRATIQKIKHSSNDFVLVGRDYFSKLIRENLKEKEANLGVGLLLGQRRSLGQDLMTALRLTGMMHIVVASGYNLTVLVRFSRRLFGRVSKYWALMGSLILVFGFMAVTGLSPSMLRAGLVSVISLLAWYYGRKLNPLILLLVTMALTVIYNPFYLWGDLGWQLSFASFAGVMLLAPMIERYFFADKNKNSLRQIALESFSAQLLTAPIIIFTFGEFSNVSLLVNLLVLPLVPLAMFLVFVVGVTGILFSGGWLVKILAYPAQWLLEYFTKIISYWAEVPWATNPVTISRWLLVAGYGFITMFSVYLYLKTKDKIEEYNLIV